MELGVSPQDLDGTMLQMCDLDEIEYQIHTDVIHADGIAVLIELAASRQRASIQLIFTKFVSSFDWGFLFIFMVN